MARLLHPFLPVVSGFETPLRFEDSGGYPFVLTAPLRYTSARLGYAIIVPPGFSTDLASIPWLIQPLLPRVGRWDRAAVIHDRLYDRSMRTHWRPRSLCDAVFREAMAADGVKWVPRYLIWFGVRVGGWLAWYRDGHRNI